MSTIFTMPGKVGDSILQWPVAFHYARLKGEKIELWLDEATGKPLVSLFEAQPCVTKVKLVGGVENYNCGGQPFHMNIPTSAFEGNVIYHLGMRSFPVRQISLQTLQDSRIPVTVPMDEFTEMPTLDVGPVSKSNRLVVHGQSVCPHNGSSPTMWRFLHAIKDDIHRLFTEVVFVGSQADREVGLSAYPNWTAFDDGGDFLKLAQFIAGSRCMIGVGSSPVTLAGALKVPSVRVHDRIGNDAPKVIWNNLGENQVNETEIGLRKEWPRFREKWLTVDSGTLQA